MKKLSYYCFGLVFLTCSASAENAQWVEWIGDVEFSYGGTENLNLSAFAEEEVDDELFQISAAFGRYYQFDGNTRMHIAANLESAHYNDVDGLDNTSGGLSVGLRHKFGVGLEVPYMQINLAYRDRNFDDDVRDREEYEISVELGKNFSERFSLAGRFAVISADTDPGPVVPLDVFFGIPNIPSDPFEHDFWTASVFADYVISNDWLASFEYTRRDGDFDSACSVNLDKVVAAERVSAITFQDSFPGCAYQVDGTANIFSVSVGYAISAHSGLNLGVSFYEGDADVLDYSSNSFQFSYNYRY